MQSSFEELRRLRTPTVSKGKKWENGYWITIPNATLSAKIGGEDVDKVLAIRYSLSWVRPKTEDQRCAWASIAVVKYYSLRTGSTVHMW